MGKLFSDKRLFRMTLDESLILLFEPRRKTMFTGKHFKYGFTKSFMLSVVTPRKNPDFNPVWFCSWQSVFVDFMKHGIPSNLPFTHLIGVIGSVLLFLLCGNSLNDLRILWFSWSCLLTDASCSPYSCAIFPLFLIVFFTNLRC